STNEERAWSPESEDARLGHHRTRHVQFFGEGLSLPGSILGVALAYSFHAGPKEARDLTIPPGSALATARCPGCGLVSALLGLWVRRRHDDGPTPFAQVMSQQPSFPI